MEVEMLGVFEAEEALGGGDDKAGVFAERGGGPEVEGFFLGVEIPLAGGVDFAEEVEDGVAGLEVLDHVFEAVAGLGEELKVAGFRLGGAERDGFPIPLGAEVAVAEGSAFGFDFILPLGVSAGGFFEEGEGGSVGFFPGSLGDVFLETGGLVFFDELGGVGKAEVGEAGGLEEVIALHDEGADRGGVGENFGDAWIRDGDTDDITPGFLGELILVADGCELVEGDDFGSVENDLSFCVVGDWKFGGSSVFGSEMGGFVEGVDAGLDRDFDWAVFRQGLDMAAGGFESGMAVFTDGDLMRGGCSDADESEEEGRDFPHGAVTCRRLGSVRQMYGAEM